MRADFSITKHAAKRWMQRTGERDPYNLAESWDLAWSDAVEVELKPDFRLKALLNHRCRSARYFRSTCRQWVFVVVAGSVVTVHSALADRWLPPSP